MKRGRQINEALNALPTDQHDIVILYIQTLEEAIKLARLKIEYLEGNESFHQHELLIAQNR